MADRDLQNGTMSYQNCWQKKLWRITIDSPKFFTEKVFFCMGFGLCTFDYLNTLPPISLNN